MATIKVQNSLGNPVENAQVRLYAEPTVNSTNEIIADYTKLTNHAGEAYFNLTNLYEPGQNGVGVFKIKVLYQNLVGENLIEIEQENNNVCVVTLQ